LPMRLAGLCSHSQRRSNRLILVGLIVGSVNILGLASGRAL